MAHVRINFPLLQQKFYENSEIFPLAIVSCPRNVFRGIIFYQRKAQLSFHKYQNHWSGCQRCPFKHQWKACASGCRGLGSVWVNCQKTVNDNAIHYNKQAQILHVHTSRSICPRKTVKNPHATGWRNRVQVEESRIVGNKETPSCFLYQALRQGCHPIASCNF